tara:strand:- start:6442 stop:6561 length:120 start_codon:yes stop_codon:yes gene_type:complete
MGLMAIKIGNWHQSTGAHAGVTTANQQEAQLTKVKPMLP